MIIDVAVPKRSRLLQVTIIASIVLHGVAWAALTNFGQHPVSESYIVKVIINEKPPQPTPDEKKIKQLIKKAEQLPQPKDVVEPELKPLKQLIEKPIENKMVAKINTNRIHSEAQIVNLNQSFNRNHQDSNQPMVANLNTGSRGAGAGADGPVAKAIAIGGGRKGGIGISSSGEGTIGIKIGSGLGGGRGAGRGSGTGDGPDSPNVFLGGVGTGRGGGGGGGGGGGIQMGALPGGGGRSSGGGGPPAVSIAPVSQKAAKTTEPGVSGEWVRAEIAGSIAGLQVKCLNNPGVFIFGDTKIQCSNNMIVAAWKRR